MMKKNRLTTGYVFDFELIGIVSSSKEYKLAWHLNQLHIFHLVKKDDIRIEFANNQQIRISNLMEQTDHSCIYLLKNKLISTSSAANQFLIPELQQFDYLMKISNQADENWADHLLLNLKHIPVIDYALKIDVEKIKTRDNLVF